MSYQSKHTGTTIDNAITDMQSLQSIILNTVYPVELDIKNILIQKLTLT